jgi:hypothetical protein
VVFLIPFFQSGIEKMTATWNFKSLCVGHPIFKSGGKFKLSAQGSDLAPFVGNGTKIQILSEIKQGTDICSCP